MAGYLSAPVDEVGNGLEIAFWRVDKLQREGALPLDGVQTQHWYFPEYSRVEWLLNAEFENDIAQQIGFWQLYAAGDKYTVAEYGTLVDTGVAVPAKIQDILARRDIPKALDHFQRLINSNRTWLRDGA